MTKQAAKGEQIILFQGKNAERKFWDLEIPEFPQREHMCVDFYNTRNLIQPLRYKSGDNIWLTVEGPNSDKIVFDMVFQFFGTPAQVEVSKAAVGEWAKLWIQQVDQKSMHLAQRYLYSDNPKYRADGTEPQQHPGVLRTLVIRLYRNEDFDCTEHPEFLIGEPIGMYHCPVCGDMQMAGAPHIKEEA